MKTAVFRGNKEAFRGHRFHESILLADLEATGEAFADAFAAFCTELGEAAEWAAGDSVISPEATVDVERSAFVTAGVADEMLPRLLVLGSVGEPEAVSSIEVQRVTDDFLAAFTEQFAESELERLLESPVWKWRGENIGDTDAAAGSPKAVLGADGELLWDRASLDVVAADDIALADKVERVLRSIAAPETVEFRDGQAVVLDARRVLLVDGSVDSGVYGVTIR